MKVIDRLLAEIREKQEQIVSIQKGCSHPEAAIQRTPRSFSRERMEEDDYGLMVTVQDLHQGHHAWCELCGTSWSEIDGEEQRHNIRYYDSP